MRTVVVRGKQATSVFVIPGAAVSIALRGSNAVGRIVASHPITQPSSPPWPARFPTSWNEAMSGILGNSDS